MPNSALDQLAADYWDAFLERNPVQGTALGDHRYDDRLTDITPAGKAAAERRLEELWGRVADLGSSGLTGWGDRWRSGRCSIPYGRRTRHWSPRPGRLWPQGWRTLCGRVCGRLSSAIDHSWRKRLSPARGTRRTPAWATSWAGSSATR